MAVVNRDPSMVTVNMVESTNSPGGVKLVDPKNTHCKDPMDLVQLANQIQKANEFVRANAVNRLTVIADQMRYLHEQARKVLVKSQKDDLLHKVPCNMVKRPGTIYYLYERPSGEKHFSFLSQEEWGQSCPNTFLGGFRLEYDMSWTPVPEMEQRSKEIDMIDNILKTQKTITDSSALFRCLTAESPTSGIADQAGIAKDCTSQIRM